MIMTHVLLKPIQSRPIVSFCSIFTSDIILFVYIRFYYCTIIIILDHLKPYACH